MAFARGTYGIEYDPRQRENEPSGLGWLFALVALVALVSLIFTWISHYRSSRAERELVAAEAPAAPAVPAIVTNALTVPPAAEVVAAEVEKRPHQLQVLLMRREEAVKSRNLELEASTIESIRQLPAAADLEDALARRLGTINLVRLWGRHNRQWVKEVEVKRGDSASRIAIEHGSTLASMQKLNGDSLERLIAGQKLLVMDHPHFQLVVHRRLRTADLMLEDRFFKRYDLTQAIGPAVGRYELADSFRNFLKSTPLEFRPADCRELDALLPSGTPVLISEM